MTRLVSLALGSSLVVAAAVSTVGAQKGSAPIYAPVASVDDAIGSRGLRLHTFAFDAKAHRVYAGSRLGLYWLDVAAAKPAWNGPAFKLDVYALEFAPDLQRLFFSGDDGIGYVSVESLGRPEIFSKERAHDIAYEASRREVYVVSRAPRVRIYDGETAKLAATVDLSGRIGSGLETIPGRVFLMQDRKQGIYSIDAKTRELVRLQTSEKIVTPAQLEADPSGKVLFAAYYQNLVAIDPLSGKILGRVRFPDVPYIAFDPGANLLLATWEDDPTPIRVAAFRLTGTGLSKVSELENPPAGDYGVEPTSHGFIQSGVNRFYLWTQRTQDRP